MALLPSCSGADRGSHPRLAFVFAFHDDEEIAPRMLSRIARSTVVRPEDLQFRFVGPTTALSRGACATVGADGSSALVGSASLSVNAAARPSFLFGEPPSLAPLVHSPEELARSVYHAAPEQKEGASSSRFRPE